MNESVESWLAELAVAPSATIEKLVLGYSGVMAWSQSSLREVFVEIFHTHVEALDTAVSSWLQERLLKLPPEKTPTLVWAARLRDLFSAIAGLPLPRTARLLRNRLRDFRSWLRPLCTEQGPDPEAAYLSALAWAETNQNLEGMWQGLARLSSHEQAYYRDIGLLGLGKARDERGKLPSKAPFLLLATLIDLADLPGVSRAEWEITTRALLGGYPYSLDTWAREFESVLEARHNAQNGPKWLRKILRLPPEIPATHGVASADPSEYFSLYEIDRFVEDVERGGPDRTDERLEALLESQRMFARVTNNPHHLVRTFNRLAKAAEKYDPDWALARAEEAFEWHKGDPYNWTRLARSLWVSSQSAYRQGKIELAKIMKRESLDTLWTARFRIPYNIYIRTELAKLHLAVGNPAVAESIYREASAEFPSDTVPRCGLAEVVAFRNVEEAEKIYRETIDKFSDVVVPRDGLASLLQRNGRTEEAVKLYHETSKAFPQDPRSRISLADILYRRSIETRNEQEREEARKLYQEAEKLGDSFARLRLIKFDERWHEFAGQPPLITEVEAPQQSSVPNEDVSEMGPAERLGRALLAQWLGASSEDASQREEFFLTAEKMLDLRDELTGECQGAFIEARGFLLLARGQTSKARAYFEQKITVSTRPSLGLRLGFAEARTRLGETLSENDEATLSSFGPKGSILPLILKTIRLLESSASDESLRDLIFALYPQVRELAGVPISEIGEDDPLVESIPARQESETADSAVSHLLLASVFRPAAVNSPEDLQAVDSIPRIRKSLKLHRADIFSFTEKLALAL